MDDSRDFRAAARLLLERQGVAVVGDASTGAEALERVAELRPEIVLLDVALGEESGFDLARQLEQQLGSASPQMIMISTRGGADYAELVADSPAVGFVSKAELSAQAILDVLSEPRGT